MHVFLSKHDTLEFPVFFLNVGVGFGMYIIYFENELLHFYKIFFNKIVIFPLDNKMLK